MTVNAGQQNVKILSQCERRGGEKGPEHADLRAYGAPPRRALFEKFGARRNLGDARS
jgi:hypothetical protein